MERQTLPGFLAPPTSPAAFLPAPDLFLANSSWCRAISARKSKKVEVLTFLPLPFELEGPADIEDE